MIRQECKYEFGIERLHLGHQSILTIIKAVVIEDPNVISACRIGLKAGVLVFPNSEIENFLC